MSLNFNDAGPQKSFDAIPHGTVATVHLTVRPGNAGDGGWLRRSNDGRSEGLDCEFTVTDGDYRKRKFWGLFTVAGTTDGHAEAADISRRRFRAILESARGIRPDDQSEAAAKARQIASYGDLDGLRFMARIGIEKGTGDYTDKNVLLEAITPDKKPWKAVEQVAKPAAAATSATSATAKPATSAPVKIEKPRWAKKQ